MKRALLILGLILALGACASTHESRIDPAASHPSTAKPADPRVQVVAAATAMLGQPYRWGGMGPGGFDCSGLVAYANIRAGIQMPRTAKEQLRTGLPIARRDLQAGDLVFMHLARKELHVGIAIDDHRFVHAPSKGGFVRIDSLDAPPYAHGFLTARRIVEDPQRRRMSAARE